MQKLAVFTLAGTLFGCIDLHLPARPPPPGPGSVIGTVVFARPGLSTLQPAAGATVELLGSGVTSRVSEETGAFVLRPVAASSSAIIVRFDGDGDGRPDKQRLVSLSDLEMGPGKAVSVGQVVVGSTGVVSGKVLRADVTGTSGHGGSAVAVVDLPLATVCSDDGSFVLENVPEGRLTIAVFRPGYAPVAESVSLRAQELFTMQPLRLSASDADDRARVQGRVVRPDGIGVADVRVAFSTGATTSTDEDGRYRLTLPYGLYAVGFSKAEFLTAKLFNAVVVAPTVTLPDIILAEGTSTPADLDAGSTVGSGADAGIVDAGSAGGMDAGGMDAGGVDAGGAPVALIDVPPFVMPNASFTLSGQRSTGARPLTFTWSQDAGIPVAIPGNGTPLAATPVLTAPSSPTLLKFTLVVTDPGGQHSQPTSVLLPVASPPTAVISQGAPSTAYALQRVVLSGNSSSDPNGAGIASWEWAVSPVSITATPLGSGDRLQLDMPPAVGTSTVVTVTLSVVNGLLLRSAPVSFSFTLTSQPAPTWTLDPGATRTVGSGETVVLSALADSPVSGATFTYAWSPGSDGPDGGPPDWQLGNPATQTTAFIAPRVDGPTPRLLPFTVTATETTGVLSPTSRSATVIVSVIDRRPPTLLRSSISTGTQGELSGWLLFDEPIEPSSVDGNTLSLTAAAGSPPASIIHRSVNGARVSFGFDRPLGTGFMYTLNVGFLTDRAPAPTNVYAGRGPVPFFPARRWTEAWKSAASSTTEPWPGLVVRRPSGAGPAEVFVFARDDGATWFGAPFDPTRCALPPCIISTDVTAPAVALTGPLPRGHKGTLVDGRPVATLQLADPQGTPGVAYRYETPGGWQVLPPPPGLVFTTAPGTVAHAIQVDDGGVKLTALSGGAWVTQAVVTTDPDFLNGPTADPLFSMVQATASRPGGFFVAARSSTSGNGRVFFPSGGSSWWLSTQLIPGGSDPVVDVRSAMTGFSAGLLVAQRQSGAVEMQCEGAGTCGTNGYFTSVSAFDLVPAANAAVYFVTASAGAIELWLGGTQSPPTRLPGPLRGGMPSTVLNDDPACFAHRPEVTMFEGVLYVAWQERCGAGPWRVFVRALE